MLCTGALEAVEAIRITIAPTLTARFMNVCFEALELHVLAGGLAICISAAAGRGPCAADCLDGLI